MYVCAFPLTSIFLVNEGKAAQASEKHGRLKKSGIDEL